MNKTDKSNALAFTMRCNPCDLVTLDRFFKLNATNCNSRGEVARKAIEYVASLVREQQPELTCNTLNEASAYFRKLNFGELGGNGNRNFKSFQKQLALESGNRSILAENGGDSDEMAGFVAALGGGKK